MNKGGWRKQRSVRESVNVRTCEAGRETHLMQSTKKISPGITNVVSSRLQLRELSLSNFMRSAGVGVRHQATKQRHRTLTVYLEPKTASIPTGDKQSKKKKSVLRGGEQGGGRTTDGKRVKGEGMGCDES